MRQIYLLLATAIGLLSFHSRAQDIAGFTFTIGDSNRVHFTNTSVINGDGDHKAFWIFGDGNQQITAPLANTEHRYANARTYTVCLKIYKYTVNHDSVVTADICKTVTLAAAVDRCEAGFEHAAAANSLLTQVFVAKPGHNNSKRPELICWNFGDQHDTCIHYNPAQTYNYAVYHTYRERGLYKVCVTIKYQGGCQASYCNEVQLGRTDSCTVGYRTEAADNSPLVRYFIAQPWNSLGKKPLRVCWKFGDGKDSCIQYNTSAPASYVVRHEYAHSGKYEACVSVLFDGGCEAHFCKVETVGEPPAPQPDTCFVELQEATTRTSNFERKFYAGLTPGKVPLKICWRFGDGRDSCVSLSHPPTDGQLTMTHIYPAPGRYEVCAQVWYDGGCTAHKCRVVEISSTSSNICGGFMTDSLVDPKTVVFKGFGIQNANDHVISWQWSFGDGMGGSTQQIQHSYVNKGQYEVCLAIRTDRGCQTKICKLLDLQSTDGTNARLVLSPNPVGAILHAVFYSSQEQDVNIFIYNANGVLVKTFKKHASAGANNWEFETSGLTSGVYSMVVQSGNQVASAVFFKQ